jgi:hypothetical protein
MTAHRWLLAGFILLFPFYVFESGLPQPAHALLALACVIGLRPLAASLRTPDRAVLLPLLLFTGYAAIVNGYHSIGATMSPADFPLVRSAYLFFNCAVFAVFLTSLRRGGPGDLRFFVGCAVGSVVALALFSIAYPILEFGRLLAFFNNPNQLGYYALAMLAAGLAFFERGGMSAPLAAVFTASCLYLTLRSLSVAAIVSIVVMLLLVGARTARLRRPLAASLALSLVALALFAWFSGGGALPAALERRSDRLGRLVTRFAEDRFLTWFVDHPQYLILGAGEGAAERFTTARAARGAEVHSTVGVVLFAYGLPGAAFFLLFLWRMVRAGPAFVLSLVVPLLIYGLAHNGLRFSIVWFSLAVIYFTARLPAPLRDVPPIALWPRAPQTDRDAISGPP